MADARPYFGDPGVLDAGTLIGGTLYKFTASQVHKLHPRTLPTMASCGAKPLVDVSGGVIAQGPADNFKYCLALADGDCQNGSASGDLYVNCPQVRFPSCVSQGVGQSNPDTQDICVSDMGAHAINITQIAVDKPDPDGNFSRRVTAAFSRYSWIFPFWNAKAMPNGRWMLVWSTYFQGLRNSVLLVKLPPFPAETDGLVRNDFMPYLVKIATPQVPGASVTNAVVQFGYDKRFFCTSRQETCIQGSAADFAYRRENPAGVPCANGCTIPVPAISQRVLYFQVLLRDAGNNVVAKMEPEAVAIQ